MPNKGDESKYLQSLENKGFQEATFLNLTTANFFEQANKKKATSLSSVASSSSYPPSITAEQSTELVNKKLEEIDQYVGKDNTKVNNNYLSVGTIIKRAEMIKHINYNSLSLSDIALVQLALRKINKIFKNSRNAEERYWNSKNYQRKASKFNEKTGYELISVISLYNTEIYIRLMQSLYYYMMVLNTLFPSVEFAPYAGPKKIKTDRSKLLVEAKTIYDKWV
ncbi:hypothetical protein RO3G_11738 [Rhizopus delemar RA 99-880]|uniref:Uncharacterized protein n=1 Tax=Rhizopus delemar (strain RA 99-880 / ATCC MYA-4621 / FGSC 9543 / NRRL 43880) TaxID=246409 RepID=I1CEZ7_RHIO9|nr:hypothetical protein RO3G_11738 [Rhizopus delemar RA 99-880]|eukprot:EIE87027.1 hypothetical protein RO3G_11738 [Rhizopus delemar RA 99-880]